MAQKLVVVRSDENVTLRDSRVTAERNREGASKRETGGAKGQSSDCHHGLVLQIKVEFRHVRNSSQRPAWPVLCNKVHQERNLALLAEIPATNLDEADDPLLDMDLLLR